MKRIFNKTGKIEFSCLSWCLSLLFGGAIFFFWHFVAPYHLSFREQYQLFLFSGEYFFDVLSNPGGLSMLTARFLTQFYYYQWIGAIILTLLLLALQRLTWSIMIKFSVGSGVKQYLYFLSFIPSFVFWAFLCDENYMLGGLISLLFAIITIKWTLSFTNSFSRLIISLASIPALFWLSGNVFWFPFVFILFYEKTHGKKNFTWIRFAGWLFSGILIAAAIVLVTYSYLVQYPINRLFIGLNVFRSAIIMPPIQHLGVLFFFFVVFLYVIFPHFRKRGVKFIWGSVLTVFTLLLGYQFLDTYMSCETEEYMTYDYHVRHRQWNDIIDMANGDIPRTPYTVAYLNLALGKTGQLGNRMFHYFQNGSKGLIPDFTKHYVGALVSSEIYYHLGLINIGQCHVFEAMEAIPDKQKSVRAFQRLTETNMINYQYAVAEKYAKLLKRTLFYKDWAENALNCITDSNEFNQHDEWVYLRDVRTDDDFVYSPSEKDMMLGLLYEHNYRNKMAFEYLMAYCLLQKDIPRFVKYFSVGRNLNYSEIPRHFQQALVVFWIQTHGTIEGIPWPINPTVYRTFGDYVSVFSEGANAKKDILKKKYGNTFWYYLNFGTN